MAWDEDHLRLFEEEDLKAQQRLQQSYDRLYGLTETPLICGTTPSSATQTPGCFDRLWSWPWRWMLLWATLIPIVVITGIIVCGGIYWYSDYPKVVKEWIRRSLPDLGQYFRTIGNYVRATIQKLRREIDGIRYNRFVDTAYLKYQEVIFWIGRHKLLTLMATLIIWNIGAIIKSTQRPIVKFMPWREFQPLFHKPLPEVLLRSPLEHGSNSHFHDRVFEDAIPESSPVADWPVEYQQVEYQPAEYQPMEYQPMEYQPVEDLPFPDRPYAYSLPDEAADNIWIKEEFNAPRNKYTGAPLETRFLGNRIAYCLECQQYHCCELPY